MTNYQLYPDHPVFGASGYIKKTESDGTTCHIPNNPKNRYYREYLEWVAAGNTPEPAEEAES